MVKASLQQGSKKVSLNKPLVRVECTASTSNISQKSQPGVITFPPGNSPMSDSSSDDWTIPVSSTFTTVTAQNLTGAYPTSSEYGFQRVDLEIPGSTGPSETGVFFMPLLFTSLLTNHTKLSLNNTFACTVDAQWVPTDPWIDPSTDFSIHEADSNPLLSLGAFKTASNNMKIELGWLHYLDVMNPKTNLSAFQQIFQIFQHCHPSYPGVDISDAPRFCLEVGMALYIADALAGMANTLYQYRILIYGYGWELEVPISRSVPESDYAGASDSLGNSSEVHRFLYTGTHGGTAYAVPNFTVSQYGYGYGMSESIGIYIAAVILLLHVVLVITHVAVVGWGGWSCGAWGRMGEVLALAINSTPVAMLRNSCAGIEKLGRGLGWLTSERLLTDAHLELCFEDGTVLDSARVNEAASEQSGRTMGDDHEKRVRRRVVPGKKYGGT